MIKLLAYEVEVRRTDGSTAYAIMVWPPALTKGQRVNVPVNSHESAHGEIIEVATKHRDDGIKHKVIVREMASAPRQENAASALGKTEPAWRGSPR